MFPVVPGAGPELDQLLGRLARHPLVDGVLLIGSTGRGQLGPASDYDLLVVLGYQPLPLRAVLTHRDGRDAEVFFIAARLIRSILESGPPLPPESDAAFVAQWLRDGRIVLDRDGFLAWARRAFRAVDWTPPSQPDSYALWFKLNSFLRQIDRLTGSADPIDRIAADFKLAQVADELLRVDALAHGIAWQGAKHVLRQLAARDPACLAAWQALVTSPDLPARAGRLRQLAERILAPLGGTWDPDEDGLQLEPGTPATPATLARARAFWTELSAPPRFPAAHPE